MNKFPLLLGGAALLLSAVPQTQAVDTDPGYTSSSSSAVYYRPTLRYYGKDYTVAYGFVPWDKRAARLKPLVVDDRLTLSQTQVARFGSRSPRVVFSKRKPAVSKITAPVRPPVIRSEAAAEAPAAEARQAQ